MKTFGSNRRKTSQRNKKSRPFGKLTIDTRFAAHGNTFPYESRIQELSFVSFAESKARKDAHTRKGSLNQQPERPPPIRPGAQQTVSESISQQPGETSTRMSGCGLKATIFPDHARAVPAENSLTLPAVHKRVKGIRPSPLDLSTDVSPSDQAIPIGIALSPSTVSGYNGSSNLSSSSSSPSSARGAERTRPVKGIDTPIIVITPARDRFSPTELARSRVARSASSVYSRYTNGQSKLEEHENRPPVPPLPFLRNPISKWSMSTAPGRDSTLTTGTAFEEDVPPYHSHVTGSETVHPEPSSATLLTPRQGRGWWNIITSPFSAKSFNASFWKSPMQGDRFDRTPILGDVESMGMSDQHAGIIFTNRLPDDDELRSAPASTPAHTKHGGEMPLPKRANTAPGTLDPGSTDFNVYQIPAFGEAAAYYDSNRHFPSLCLESRSVNDPPGKLEGWSPSHSVFIPERDRDSHISDTCGITVVDGEFLDRGITGSPELATYGEASTATRPNIFSTPSEHELENGGFHGTPPTRGLTQNTIGSLSSPTAATPVLQDAHVAHVVRSLPVETRPPEETPTPSHYGLGYATLGAATISHSQDDRNAPINPPIVEKSVSRAVHTRQDSRGLGISDSESELFPPPPRISEKPRLGTDRFGQLAVRSDEDGVKDSRPWYRRFFWSLAAIAALLLAVIIILMVVFIPQKHTDMPIQASWMNLTGFPAMAVGISTVIHPNNTESRNSCVSVPSMWSCGALEDENASSLPNFRFEVRFRNGTLPSNETGLSISDESRNNKRWQESSSRHNFVRTKRSPWSAYLFSPSPSPPSERDQEFLGRTTDNVSVPYGGEETPFYITILNAIALPALSDKSALRKRASNFTYPYPTTSDEQQPGDKNASTAAATDIPSAAANQNGEPLDQDLFPFVTAQPLRLFDRGKDSEHYGFYTYFDRSIFVSGLSSNSKPPPPPSNSSNPRNSSSTAASASANANPTNASAVCTFSQTRFLVQIWTRKGVVAQLTGGAPAPSPAANSSANDMRAPGSFPYPITVTLDRHGGRAEGKGVYCYGLDERRHVMGESGWWVDEDRAAGGGGDGLVNAAEVPGGESNGTGTTDVSERDDGGGASGDGSIDGGTGGCQCQWQNWK